VQREDNGWLELGSDEAGGEVNALRAGQGSFARAAMNNNCNERLTGCVYVGRFVCLSYGLVVRLGPMSLSWRMCTG